MDSCHDRFGQRPLVVTRHLRSPLSFQDCQPIGIPKLVVGIVSVVSLPSLGQLKGGRNRKKLVYELLNNDFLRNLWLFCKQL